MNQPIGEVRDGLEQFRLLLDQAQAHVLVLLSMLQHLERNGITELQVDHVLDAGDGILKLRRGLVDFEERLPS